MKVPPRLRWRKVRPVDQPVRRRLAANRPWGALTAKVHSMLTRIAQHEPWLSSVGRSGAQLVAADLDLRALDLSGWDPLKAQTPGAIHTRPLATEIHLRFDAWGLPMRADGTPGQDFDHRGFDLVMGDDLPAPMALLGDEGYKQREQPNLGRDTQHRARDPDASLSQSLEKRRPRPLRAEQPHQALHRQAQARPAHSHALRRDRRQLPWLRRPRLHPPMDLCFCQQDLSH